jgi:DNA protecting protein DprA
MNAEHLSILQLMLAKGIGTKSLARIIAKAHERPGVLAGVASMSPEELVTTLGLRADTAQSVADNGPNARELAAELDRRSISMLMNGSQEYPFVLSKRLGAEAPPVLFAMGNTDILGRVSVGFCGSRKSSEKGLRVTADCARILAANGVNVVSGYAHGVDLAAHRSSLAHGSTTTFVLAEGILHFRAKAEVASLLDDSSFVAVSEFLPRLPWTVHSAMQRNKTICGLSDAMILVESGTTGGTFAAGKAALDIGTPLFVVEYLQPPLSAEGNAYFLANGAVPLRGNRLGEPNLGAVLDIVGVRKAATA